MLALCLLLAGCGDRGAPETPAADDGDATVLAEVGQRVITLEDVRQQMRASGGALSPEEALNRLIRRTALVETALAAGLDESEAVRAAWENALVRELRVRELDPELASAEPSERQLRAIYERTLDRFQQPERRRLAIVMVPDADALAAFTEAWNTAMDSVPPDSGFGEIALRKSQHQRTRYTGGILPWLERADSPPGVPPQLLKKGFLLTDIGAVSEPQDTGQGWAVVRLVNLEPAYTIRFEEARPELEAEARRELRRSIEDRFLHEAESKAGVSRRNPNALKNLISDSSSPPGFR